MENFKDNIESPNSNNLHSIDDQIYYIDISMWNQLDDQEPFKIPYFLIDSISIEEILTDFNTKGWIVINNEYEIMEKILPFSKKAPHVFRTDGRNKIRIQICPILKTSQQLLTLNQENDESEEFRKKWEINLDCVIYDVEDLDTPNVKIKKRKFYFHDERYQIFSEKNIEWSTAFDGRLEEKLPITKNYSDSERVCRANFALKSIIKKAGTYPDGKKIFVGGLDIKNPTFPINVDDLSYKQWEEGTPEQNNIFYTSPAYSTVMDDIKYILEYCHSDTNGPVFLDFGRYQYDKTFKLHSLKNIFENSEKEQVEHLIIEDGILEFSKIRPDGSIESIGQKPYIPKAPNQIIGNTQNFTSSRASIIKSYRFSPMVASDDARISTSPIHNFDFSDGVFNCYFNGNKVEDVQKTLTNLAKDGLYSFKNSQNNNPHVLLNINQTKQKAIKIENYFEPLQYFSKCLPRNRMVRDILFLNESISFIVNGLTIRAPGKFIFIDKLSSNGDPDPFDDRFLGQWLIIKVVHHFNQGNYFSEIVATKIDAFRKIWNVLDKNY